MKIKEIGKLIKVNESHSDGVRIFTNLGPGDIYISGNTAYCPEGMADFRVFEGLEIDTENCTIRELEFFKIGFEHGKRVAKKEFYNP